MRNKITRRATTRTTAIAALTGLAALGTGCVSQSEYDKLWETNRSLTNQNAELRDDLSSLRSANSALEGNAGDAGSVIGRLRDQNQNLRNQLGDAQQSLRAFEDRMNAMDIAALDPATDRALRRLAGQHPELIVYDADRGMLRLTSDLTFDSGSDNVKSDAAQTLERLAGVLSTTDAGVYDIQIVGHTDDRNPGAVTRRNHPTNVHLSAHRAIAVRSILGDSGVEWDRMSVMGWGEHRPAVPNNPDAGTAANRRVEIFLTASTWDGASGGATADAPTGDAGSSIDPIK